MLSVTVFIALSSVFQISAATFVTNISWSQPTQPELFRQYQKKYGSKIIPLSRSSQVLRNYTRQICNCQWAQASKIFEEMQHQGVVPDVIAYNALIGVCLKGIAGRRAAQQSMAMELFHAMKQRGVVPNLITHALINSNTVDDKTGEFQFATPIEAVLRKAIEYVFSRWTLLNVALYQGWDKPSKRRDDIFNSKDSKEELLQETIAYLDAATRKRTPKRWDDPNDVHELAEWMLEALQHYFEVLPEDQSDEEIATYCLRLYNTCLTGDFSFAEELIAHLQDKPSALDDSKVAIDGAQYGLQEGGLILNMEDLNVESVDPERNGGSGSDDKSEDDLTEDEVASSGTDTDQAAERIIPNAIKDQAAERPILTKFLQEYEPPIVNANGFMAVRTRRQAAEQAKTPPMVDEDGFMAVRTRRQPPEVDKDGFMTVQTRRQPPVVDKDGFMFVRTRRQAAEQAKTEPMVDEGGFMTVQSRRQR